MLSRCLIQKVNQHVIYEYLFNLIIKKLYIMLDCLTKKQKRGESMNPDIFEAMMLVCFGCAWPFSIYKTWKIKSSKGKSILFLSVILAGYIFGILFELFGEFNDVIYLYILNASMVAADTLLTYRYRNT